jgi:hypothetical protein
MAFSAVCAQSRMAKKIAWLGKKFVKTQTLPKDSQHFCTRFRVLLAFGVKLPYPFHLVSLAPHRTIDPRASLTKRKRIWLSVRYLS